MWALCNFRRSSIIKLSPAQKKIFDLAPFLHEDVLKDVPLVHVWEEGGFLVDEGFNEAQCPAELFDPDGFVLSSLETHSEEGNFIKTK